MQKLDLYGIVSILVIYKINGFKGIVKSLNYYHILEEMQGVLLSSHY